MPWNFSSAERFLRCLAGYEGGPAQTLLLVPRHQSRSVPSSDDKVYGVRATQTVGGRQFNRLPAHRAISAADVEVLRDAIGLVVEPIRISYLWRPILPDPSDDLVLETAVNGRVEVVVTFNRRDFEAAAARLGLEILAPADAVRRLENRS